jgi:hypothetical protein
VVCRAAGATRAHRPSEAHGWRSTLRGHVGSNAAPQPGCEVACVSRVPPQAPRPLMQSRPRRAHPCDHGCVWLSFEPEHHSRDRKRILARQRLHLLAKLGDLRGVTGRGRVGERAREILEPGLHGAAEIRR